MEQGLSRRNPLLEALLFLTTYLPTWFRHLIWHERGWMLAGELVLSMNLSMKNSPVRTTLLH